MSVAVIVSEPSCSRLCFCKKDGLSLLHSGYAFREEVNFRNRRIAAFPLSLLARLSRVGLVLSTSSTRACPWPH